MKDRHVGCGPNRQQSNGASCQNVREIMCAADEGREDHGDVDQQAGPTQESDASACPNEQNGSSRMEAGKLNQSAPDFGNVSSFTLLKLGDPLALMPLPGPFIPYARHDALRYPVIDIWSFRRSKRKNHSGCRERDNIGRYVRPQQLGATKDTSIRINPHHLVPRSRT